MAGSKDLFRILFHLLTCLFDPNHGKTEILAMSCNKDGKNYANLDSF